MPDQIRIRNVSDYGDLDVPDLGRVVELHEEITVDDAELAQRLIDTGNFVEVHRDSDGRFTSDTGSDQAGSGAQQPSPPPPPSPPTPPGTPGAGDTDDQEGDDQ